MTSPDDFYARAVASSSGDPSLEGGASGYFSAPETGLDPNLFDGETLEPQVRSFITRTLYNELTSLGLSHPAQWVSIWLAGSGVSYQWAADRGNGDLDVLFGVDWPTLILSNRDWAGVSELQFADWLNEQLKSGLWQRTSQQEIGGRTYEVTFYLNPGVGRDISVIKPYAAYDVRKNGWTVHPTKPDVTSYPTAWHNATHADQELTQELLVRHSRLHAELAAEQPGTGRWHNLGSALNLVGSQAQALWDDIHGGRHEAFTEQGHGYGDYHNFRWQVAKQSGVVNALKGILEPRQQAREESDASLYGGPIAGASEALTRAQQVNQHRPGLR